jgi:hypothetical protein
MSHTLTIDIPDGIFEILSSTARQIGKPPEAVAAQWLIAAVQQLADDPLEQFIGAFDSAGSDWADQHDYYLGVATRGGMPGTMPPESPDA